MFWKTATTWTLLTFLTAALGGCHRAPAEKLKLLTGEGDSIDLGRDLVLNPSNHAWSFRAHPGDVYRVRVDWPDGKVLIQVGSDLRDDRDDDDATHVEEIEGTAEGAHRTRALLKVHAKANAGWIRLSPQGRGVSPMIVRVDRGL